MVLPCRKKGYPHWFPRSGGESAYPVTGGVSHGRRKEGFFKRLVSGLAKTRDNIVAGFDSIFSGFSSIDEDFYEELEEILIMVISGSMRPLLLLRI